VVINRRFGRTYRSKKILEDRANWLSRNVCIFNHFTPLNKPDGGRIQFHRGGSLQSRKFYYVHNFLIHSLLPPFDIAVEFPWSNDPDNYAGGSVPTGRASIPRQVKGDDPDYKGYPGPPFWGWAWEYKSHLLKILLSLKLKEIKPESFSDKEKYKCRRIPKLRCCDELEKDVERVGCRNWIINAQ
jgi:hypothetical protein